MILASSDVNHSYMNALWAPKSKLFSAPETEDPLTVRRPIS